MYKATFEVVIDADSIDEAMKIATIEADNIESRPKDDAEAEVMDITKVDRESDLAEIVDEKRVDWDSQLGEIGFDVWEAGTYKLVKVDG